MPKSNVGRAGAAALLAMLVFPAAPAQEAYPARPVRLIVPSSPGGGTEAVARSAPDGYGGNSHLAMEHSADGADPVFSRTPQEFAAFMRAELAKWANVVKGANIAQQQVMLHSTSLGDRHDL